jgi:hypothetical protein
VSDTTLEHLQIIIKLSYKTPCLCRGCGFSISKKKNTLFEEKASTDVVNEKKSTTILCHLDHIVVD